MLNDAFAGRGAANHSARTPFQFRTKSIDYTANSDWYDWADPDEDPSDEVEAKAALHQGGFDDLNIYIAALGDGLLGYAYLPGIAPLTYDGVVLLNESLPAGTRLRTTRATPPPTRSGTGSACFTPSTTAANTPVTT